MASRDHPDVLGSRYEDMTVHTPRQCKKREASKILSDISRQIPLEPRPSVLALQFLSESTVIGNDGLYINSARRTRRRATWSGRARIHHGQATSQRSAGCALHVVPHVQPLMGAEAVTHVQHGE
jgi:hypothetical protein